MSASREWFPLTGALRRPGAARLAAAKNQTPVDPLDSPAIGIAGRVVTMNDTFAVRQDAVVYIANGRVFAIQDRSQPAPPGFEQAAVVETNGTIFPGLIDLHNHLSYNVLPLWSPVPKRFTDRGQWPNHKDYRPLISGPMTVLGSYQDSRGRYPFLAPLVRYVECKCLLGGVTTSQGVKLASNSGIQRFYRGIVRNVEQTDEPELPEVQARIPDVVAKDARSFLGRLQKEDSCFLLHLSEGTTDPANPLSPARKHFLALEIAPGQWALSGVFTGIHASGLLPQDFDVMASHGSAMVWSPLSNLLLYGATARIEAARAAGVLMGLGSDWSPTGSKNLLGEMKVAFAHSQLALNGVCSARDIVAMATRDAARILKWDKVLGSVEAGKRADLIVMPAAGGDPYEALIRAKEPDLRLVMINGVARYGLPELMQSLGTPGEAVRVGGQTRRLFLDQVTSDPAVAPVSLSTACSTLQDALEDIAQLAKDVEKPRPKFPLRALDAGPATVWGLALDETCACGVEFAPRLPFAGPRDFTGADRAPRGARAIAQPLSSLLKPMRLDRLTVPDDADFIDSIKHQPNIPDALRLEVDQLF